MVKLPMRRAKPALLLTILAAAVLSGCGSSIDPALLNSAGKHGDALEANFATLTEEPDFSVSSGALKQVHAALVAGDPNKVSAAELRRARRTVGSRIATVTAQRRDLAATNRQLRRTALPKFTQYLGNSKATTEFSADYKSTTTTVERAGVRALAVIDTANRSLKRFDDLLDEWEEYLTNGDTAGFEAAAAASDAALARLERVRRTLADFTRVNKQIDRLTARIAAIASEDVDIQALVNDLKSEYPKSFLSVHLVEQ